MEFSLGILFGSVVTFFWMSWLIHGEHLETLAWMERQTDWLRKRIQQQVEEEPKDDWWKK